MNKRSAMLIAAGLVLTMIVGGVAISVGLTGPTSTQAALRTTTRKAKPIVKVKRRTITVHRKGEARTEFVDSAGPSGDPGQTGSAGGDRTDQDEGSAGQDQANHEDGDHEDGDHEDDDHEDGDHEDDHDEDDHDEDDHADDPKDEPADDHETDD